MQLELGELCKIISQDFGYLYYVTCHTVAACSVLHKFTSCAVMKGTWNLLIDYCKKWHDSGPGPGLLSLIKSLN